MYPLNKILPSKICHLLNELTMMVDDIIAQTDRDSIPIFRPHLALMALPETIPVQGYQYL